MELLIFGGLLLIGALFDSIFGGLGGGSDAQAEISSDTNSAGTDAALGPDLMSLDLATNDSDILDGRQGERVVHDQPADDVVTENNAETAPDEPSNTNFVSSEFQNPTHGAATQEANDDDAHSDQLKTVATTGLDDASETDIDDKATVHKNMARANGSFGLNSARPMAFQSSAEV